MGFQFGGDPVVGPFELGFEEPDVVQGEIKDTLDRKSERLVQEEALVGHTLEFLRVVEWMWKVVVTGFVELGSQVLDRELS